ncbi:MAG: NAD(P)/FAD-dependent oxidoreductase [Bdellovibrionaceae bacterium]|nr:NAD(P)/FAD-dependent oxidoreductase [Pseudobdellovibrionaceae bacterium]MBX3033746.1 NAD(P)/FAD-dependent oxidoreductase [Pseudobdellovibrionaceae bacterium]
MSQHIFDYAIVGSGLSGLACAVRLSQETKNVVLLDGLDQAGGVNRPISFPTGTINNGLRFVPDTELNRQALLFLEDLLGLKVVAGAEHRPPVSFEEGRLKEFVGFGENPPEFYDQMKPFMNPDHLKLNLEPALWTSLLLEKFQGQFMPRSYVTRFQVENNEVQHLTINGAKTIRAANVIYAGPVKSLSVLMSQDSLSARARQKLAKNVYWTALCLDLCHDKTVTDSEAVHILNGTTQDEIGPCAGRFMPPTETEQGPRQTSQWVTFLDEEVTEDSELVGAALKKIKRQIKRAYPEALEGLVRERIMVSPMVGGDGELKLKGNQTMPEAHNLWIASSALAPERGVTGALLQAHLVLAALGFSTRQHHPSEVLEASF